MKYTKTPRLLHAASFFGAFSWYSAETIGCPQDLSEELNRTYPSVKDATIRYQP